MIYLFYFSVYLDADPAGWGGAGQLGTSLSHDFR